MVPSLQGSIYMFLKDHMRQLVVTHDHVAILMHLVCMDMSNNMQHACSQVSSVYRMCKTLSATVIM